MNIFREAKILLVDDESDLINSMYSFLKKKGFSNLLTAKNIAISPQIIPILSFFL
ncbi:MAG: hypothetical protein E6809_10035 [Anaerococcus vaginalis]|uniref:hypothetical protein n=1 Tax=Anaerococcus vaginalis TaxID=33037 RepID=UPI0028FF511E|nr:hypothetical protein [Anaerococcus vaginalis]MDU1764433.1 hypothetical protein [Anaerococcus vaginalis]